VGPGGDSWVRDEGQFITHSNSSGRGSAPVLLGPSEKAGDVCTQCIAFQEKNLKFREPQSFLIGHIYFITGSMSALALEGDTLYSLQSCSLYPGNDNMEQRTVDASFVRFAELEKNHEELIPNKHNGHIKPTCQV
jgi:hypothetical protein